MSELHYVGFWARVLAALVDSVIIMAITWPILVYLFGWQALLQGGQTMLAQSVNFLLSWVLPILAIILFWIYRQATPGKMLLNAQIVDANTLQKPSKSQCIIRYLGYYISAIPLGLGLIWVGIDAKKQGWHDKLAGTLVIYTNKSD
ncbi:RDD family protein [Bowmanella denitrificans]|uniref:RDD family protein n=1 Tax=Bowmanella denitrificans TaxID=366582 RepID=A0ABP3HIU2_9ALTE